MSQAVIDFCEGLKTTLLGIEDRLDKAKQSLEANAAEASSEAKKHVAEAAEQLKTFRTHAGGMAQAMRAELPTHSEVVKQKFAAFSQEAQVAMRHAVVFLAEAASKGADSAADALKAGAGKAHTLAQKLRHDTAVTVVEKTGAQGESGANPTG